MTIWDDLKPYWQLAGVALPKRTKVDVVDREQGGQSQAIIADGPGRLDVTPAETCPLYLFSTVAAPFSSTGDDEWLAPGGQMFSATAIYVPIVRRHYVSVITFHMIGTALATDSVQIDVMRASTSVPTGLTLTVPPGTTSASPLVSAPFPIVFDVGEGLALRLRQSGTVLQASWQAYIAVG